MFTDGRKGNDCFDVLFVVLISFLALEGHIFWFHIPMHMFFYMHQRSAADDATSHLLRFNMIFIG